ncbi:MAG: hypothetical protein IPI79_01745 [Moraxellaceae bacterium]|nr:hypothetical protein [Moraxellaceae bacterium]
MPFIVQLNVVQPYFRLMANVFAVDSNQDLRLVQFMVGVFGPTVASWGVLFWAVVTQSFDNPTKKSWYVMLAACVVWAFYDSIYSSFFGLWINALINGVAFVSIVLPLWGVRKDFGI